MPGFLHARCFCAACLPALTMTPAPTCCSGRRAASGQGRASGFAHSSGIQAGPIAMMRSAASARLSAGVLWVPLAYEVVRDAVPPTALSLLGRRFLSTVTVLRRPRPDCASYPVGVMFRQGLAPICLNPKLALFVRALLPPRNSRPGLVLRRGAILLFAHSCSLSSGWCVQLAVILTRPARPALRRLTHVAPLGTQVSARPLVRGPFRPAVAFYGRR